MSKKLLSVLLAAVMVVSACLMTSCGKEEWPVDEATGLTELLIGGIGPLSGAYANYGTSVYNGAKIAVDEINAAGGVNGFKLVLSFQDSEADPTSAKNAYGKLMDNGMKVSLGGVLSGETASVVAEAKSDGILVLTPSGSAKSAIEGSDTAFRICFNDPDQGKLAARYISDNGIGKKVALFYDSGTDYSSGIISTFTEAAKDCGFEIVGTPQTFTEATNTDFSTQINAIVESGADVVFMPIYAQEAAAFLTQAREAGKLKDVACFGCDGLDGVISKIGEDKVANAEGVFMLTPFAADSVEPKVVSFVAAYQAAFNAVPDQFAADGYDAIYTVAAAVAQAEIKPDSVDNFNSRLVAAMTQITVEGVTGTMTWTADGETNKAANALIIKNGVAVDYLSNR